MVKRVLVFLRNLVNEHLQNSRGWSADRSTEERVVFPDLDKTEHLAFRAGVVTMLLVNLEEDPIPRPADAYRRTLPDGTAQQVLPPIHLNAYVMFVANHSDYQDSLGAISQILQFFLQHRVLDLQSTPGLTGISEKLTLELTTLPFAELNHLWGNLRSSYRPSLLYKVRMIIFHDEEGEDLPLGNEPKSSVAVVP